MTNIHFSICVACCPRVTAELQADRHPEPQSETANGGIWPGRPRQSVRGRRHSYVLARGAGGPSHAWRAAGWPAARIACALRKSRITHSKFMDMSHPPDGALPSAEALCTHPGQFRLFGREPLHPKQSAGLNRSRSRLYTEGFHPPVRWLTRA
jgi:hypothetical protein